MKVDKAVCTTDTLDDLSRVIKFEAIFSTLVENKILAIKRECEQQKQKSKKKCLPIKKKSIEREEEQPPPDPPDELQPKNTQPATSSNHFRKILFGKKIFGTKSKFKDRGEGSATDHLDGDHKIHSQNVDECELNELNFFHHKRVHRCIGDIEKGTPELIRDDLDEVDHDDDDVDDDDVTIGPDNSSILLSDDATLKSEVKIDIGNLEDGVAFVLADHDVNYESNDRPKSCGDQYDRDSCGLNKKLRVTYNDRKNCTKTKSNSSIGGTSSRETSIYIENERARLRLLEAKSISAQCSPIFQRQKLSDLPRSHVTSFDETRKPAHPSYDQIISIPSTMEDHHVHHYPPKSKTKIKINKPRIEYDSIISYNQSTATTTTTSNTSSSPGFISTFNQLTSASSSNQIPIITTIKSSTSSSTTGSNKSIKSRRLKDRSLQQNQIRDPEMGAIHKTKQVIDDDKQSAINKPNNNSDSNSKTNNNNLNNNKNNNDNNVSNKNSNRNKKVIKSHRDYQYDHRNCDDSDEEFRKHRRKYRRTQRYSDPVLVFPSSSGLQHCILSRPPNQPLQLQYDEDFIYDVSLQLEPGDAGDLDDIITTGRRKHRHRHHRHGKKKRHKRRKMLIHDLDDQTVKVIDPDDLPQRARWTIIATAFLLLIMCLLLVGVTLRMAPIIDDMDPFACYGTDSEYHPDTSASSDVLLTNNSPPIAKVRTRTRKRNMGNWQSVRAKQQKNAGDSYHNAAGRKIPAKVMKSGCTVKCRLKCHERVPQQVREDIFNYFYKLGSKIRQWDYIANSVKVIDKKVTKISNGESRRKCSRLYYLNQLEDKQLNTRVCLKMYLDTLAISNQAVDTALLKTLNCEKDNRGKYHRPVNELKQTSKEHVVRHISSFPTVESHYLRAQTTKLFLESDLSIAKMY